MFCLSIVGSVPHIGWGSEWPKKKCMLGIDEQRPVLVLQLLDVVSGFWWCILGAVSNSAFDSVRACRCGYRILSHMGNRYSNILRRWQ